ncbi:hypothetical protein [Lacrimispora sp.]|uniref:hypothetical protein n=1 Tax=Lacrimispora sp. TaxID=2719234 RepID=UPI0034610CC1
MKVQIFTEWENIMLLNLDIEIDNTFKKGEEPAGKSLPAEYEKKSISKGPGLVYSYYYIWNL